MSFSRRASLFLSIAAAVVLVTSQQQCYFGPGAENRGPTNLVPCNSTGTSACCLLGDICLSGNACWNFETGDTYQYGCTDVNYKDETCPYKCGWDSSKSPWTGLEYCDEQDVADTWICHSPESCGCKWNATYDLLVLELRGCAAMGSDARAALYAPSTLAPYVSLPTTHGGSTGYFSPTQVSGTSTWVSTVIAGYTPDAFTQFTTYRAAPFQKVLINLSTAKPAPSTNAPATSPGSSLPQSTATGETTQNASGGAQTSGPSASPTSSSVSSSSSGLSTGAKAGVGVGAAVGGILLTGALIGFCIARRRHLQRQGNLPGQAPPQGQQYPQSPLMQNAHYSQGPPMQGQQWNPYPMGQYQDPSGMYSPGKPPNSPPLAPAPPAELGATEVREAHEMDSEVSAASPHMGKASPRLHSAGSPSPIPANRPSSFTTIEQGQ